MIAREDIVAMCGLSEDEIAAIAEHEHVPDVVAAALGRYLLDGHDPQAIRVMIKDDIRTALSRGDEAHAAQLFAALHHFMNEHAGEFRRA
jgi:hypothetical protein